MPRLKTIGFFPQTLLMWSVKTLLYAKRYQENKGFTLLSNEPI